MSSIWQAFAILTVGYILIWIAGKKVASEMTGLELITLLGNGIDDRLCSSVQKTAIVLCIFDCLLVMCYS